MAFFPWAIVDRLLIPISPPTKKKQHRCFRRIVERYRNFNNSPSVSDGLFFWLLSDQEGIHVGLHQMWCHKLRTSPTKIWAVWKMYFLLFNFTKVPIISPNFPQSRLLKLSKHLARVFVLLASDRCRTNHRQWCAPTNTFPESKVPEFLFKDSNLSGLTLIWVALPETNTSRLKIGTSHKREINLPTIHFQGRAVSLLDNKSAEHVTFTTGRGVRAIRKNKRLKANQRLWCLDVLKMEWKKDEKG